MSEVTTASGQSDAGDCSPSLFTPETDQLVRETLASPTVTDTILAAKLTLKCQELERQRDKARSGHSACCGVRDHWKAEAMRLREAALAVVDRWDTPLWKDAPATAVFIERLRKLLPENVQGMAAGTAVSPVKRD